MEVVTPEVLQGKKVLLRLDLDVPLKKLSAISYQLSDGNGYEVDEDFRLKAGLPTLKLCLEYGEEVIIMGHIGRPNGQVEQQLSVEPIYDWLAEQGLRSHLESGKLKLLENLRFEIGESFDTAQNKDEVLEYAKQLAEFGEIFVNEAFAAHHPAASTTILPTLLPCFAGLHFAKEVEELTKVRDNPKHPLVVIVGGVKIEDKIPALLTLEKTADLVLVGGKISEEIHKHPDILRSNIFLAKLNSDKTDITPETIKGWSRIISTAKMIVWNGPLGKVDPVILGTNEVRTPESDPGQAFRQAQDTEQGRSARMTNSSYEIAQAIIDSKAESIVGGGDTVSFLGKYDLLEKFSFVSTGGGAMLKFLSDGTLPTIEALN